MLKTISLLILLISTTTLLQASTNISGQIRNDTTWTKSGSPYILDGTVEVAPDVTLTLEPGVELILNYTLNVYGNIEAIGSASDMITFKTKDGWPGKIKLYKNNLSDTFTFQYSSFDAIEVDYTAQVLNLVVDNCNLKNTIIRSGGKSISTRITSCKMNTGEINVTEAGIFIAQNNEIVKAALRVAHTSKVIITGNIVSDNLYGIICYNSGHPTIQNNTVFNTTNVGMEVTGCQIDVDNEMSGNIITRNKNIGLKVESTSGPITHNTVYDNNIGITEKHIKSAAVPNFENNCIYDNNENFRYNSADSFSIPNNWWGTTDSASIDTTITDYTDDFKLGKITFMPVLQQLSTSCKTFTPTNVAEQLKEQILACYPNPFSDLFTFKVGGNRHFTQVAIYDITGKQLHIMNGQNKQQLSINTMQYPAGMYIYKVVFDDNSTATGKMSKQ